MRSRITTALLCLLVAFSGCQGWFSSISPNSQSPDDEVKPPEEDGTLLLSEAAFPFGRERIDVEGVGLVVGLPGTGGEPEPSVYRTQLLDEMSKRDIARSNDLLNSANTALVLVRGVIRPGMENGDSFDLEVKVPPGTPGVNLRGGFLLKTRLTEVAFAGGALRRGELLGLGEGYVLVDPGADEADALVGRVLGGGKSAKPHSLKLVLRPNHQSILYSKRVGDVVNKRFHTYRFGVKEKMANPKTNEYIELDIHPRYKDNVPRYLAVIGSLSLRESQGELIDRLDRLAQNLQTPSMTARAALQLEAIGAEAVPVLKQGLSSTYPEVRFYSAEALAYIDDAKINRDAAAALADAALRQPAFRVYALTALSTMNDTDSAAELRKLLHVPSAETRYGAFRSLWAMNARDPLVIADESLREKFGYHVISTSGPPMIHLTTSFRPEIVMFGTDIRFQAPVLLDAGAEILVRGAEDGSVTVSKISMHQPDQKRLVSGSVDDVIRAVAELGGQYHDIVQMLQQADQKGLLADCRLEVDALPQAGRPFVPDDGRAATEVASAGGGSRGLPNLFAGFTKSEERSTESEYVALPEQQPGFFKRMFSWW